MLCFQGGGSEAKEEILHGLADQGQTVGHISKVNIIAGGVEIIEKF